jgi:hypothetical protein
MASDKKENKITIDSNSVVLNVNLELLDSTGSVAKVNQSITLPFIKEPAFVKGAYNQIESTLNAVGVDMFKRMVKYYCMNLVHSYYNEQPPLFNQVFNDEKVVVNSSLALNDNSMDVISDNSEDVIDLDVEEEDEDDKK